MDEDEVTLVKSNTDTILEVIPLGNGSVKLRVQKFPEIVHVYKKAFIQQALDAGLLIPVSEQEKQLIF